MNSTMKMIVAAVCTGVVAVGGFAPPEAAAGSSAQSMKPMSGPGVTREGQRFLLSFEIGKKQAVSYFLNENGRCKLTMMVAEAFDGDEVPNMTTVRFETAIEPGRSARFNTADGRSLEFTCETDALAMTVTPFEQIAAYPRSM